MAVLADPDAHAAWHPYTTKIVGEHSLGELRECSVHVGGKPGTTRERCIAFDEGRAISWGVVEEDSSGFSRMVTDWSTGFRLDEIGDGLTQVVAWSRFKPRRLFVRLMLPMIKRRFHLTQREILASLRQHLEQ